MTDSDRAARLAEASRILGHSFADEGLLAHSLTHASAAATRGGSNERLEFLGDAVLGMIASDVLYERFPDDAEGALTRWKSAVVSRSTCGRIGRELGLEACLRVGKGVAVDDELPESLVSAAFEAVVAALYLDGGLDAARRFLEPLIREELDRMIEDEGGHNAKSDLQHLAQVRFGETPTYRLLGEKGPDHDKLFEVVAVIGDRTFPSAWGPNKKEAEQAAAKNALGQLEEA
ncbi:MAG: ribonuclease III [Planctomycetota bacterium]